jgi:uncharacterized protein (DUF1697 family)
VNESEARRRFAAGRVARLATVASDGRPRIVPCCFVFDGDTVYSAVDEKPKASPDLARLRDMAINPDVTFVVDEYQEDWGSRNRVAMPALRELFEELGFRDVETYVQSGNVAFGSAKKPDAVAIAKRIERDLGARSPVLIRSGADLAKVATTNPFPAAAAHVTFLEDRPKGAAVNAVDGAAFAPDEFSVVGRDVYLHCPNGYGRSKLNNAFWEKQLGTVATTRNWKTVTAMRDLTAS